MPTFNHMIRDNLGSLAREVVAQGVAPGACVGAAVRSAGGWRFSVGAAGLRSKTLPTAVDPATPFDLASVTKPIVAAAIARMVRRGRLRWETPIGELLPELTESVSAEVPLELFVAHRAGLEAHRPLHEACTEGATTDAVEALFIAASARRQDCRGSPPPSGFPPVYSDLGFLIAGIAASRAAGTDLATVVFEEVAGPLGLDLDSSHRWRVRDPSFPERVAPTEVVAYRGGELVGDVHDENAWGIAGRGLAGHAGLFGTVDGVLRFGAAMLDALAGRAADWLSAAEAQVLVRPRDGGTLRAGFDGRSDEGSSAGDAFGRHSFGHLGFTGTSLWCDPDADVVGVLLTNRVNPSRENLAVRAARPKVHDRLHRAARALARVGGP